MDQQHQFWLVSCSYDRPPGERPRPTAFVAKEVATGRTIWLEHDRLRAGIPPLVLGPHDLVVLFDAPATLGCYLTMAWPLPDNVLDLQAEARLRTSGLDVPDKHEHLVAALAYFGLAGDGLEGLERLWEALRPGLDVPRALFHGKYAAAVASIEAVGVPIDTEALAYLKEQWDEIRSKLIADVDRDFGVYPGGKFNPKLWRQWLNKHHIRWPKSPDDRSRLLLTLETFRDVALVHPEIEPVRDLQASLAMMGGRKLAVGADGRNRCPLRPFASKTGRCQPSTTEFIFGPAVWLRGLIRPPEGMAVAYLDYQQQEFALAAHLSGDPAMQAAYLSGDPYLEFARQAGAVPPHATKASHPEVREQFKRCALGVQYGMRAYSLSRQTGGSVSQADKLLRLHRGTYSTYWSWSDAVHRQAFKDGRLQATFGWTLNVPPKANARSVRNFPVQANGSEMLRWACIYMAEQGIRVCASVHDAVLIEAPADTVDEAVAACQATLISPTQRQLEFPVMLPSRGGPATITFPGLLRD